MINDIILTMKPLYTQEEFNSSKSRDKLQLQCHQCNAVFTLMKKRIQDSLNPKAKSSGKFCSKLCSNIAQRNKQIVFCKNCNTKFQKDLHRIKNTKNNFCSKSCAGTYNNKHKTHGTRRSKLEIWLEEKLTNHYPNLEIHFNKKDTIESELDIYIPSLSLAIELNGIFHYEPIFGPKKLNQIQTNDISKSKACIDKEIDLCTIDTSGQKYFKESTSLIFLDIITNIISKR